ncbi:MAG: ferritin-like domain-containing protein [Capsulimonadales bacterium]|nr:ferritin-like domain-containing protein [Capsulimonadales bacterium]
MSTNETYDITTRQMGTTRQSAAAMLDPETESRLYQLYRQFFRDSEDRRNWNLWTDIPWDSVVPEPPTALATAVFDLYRADLFLPDYSARSLHLLRASRGRAWFWTRWSYEEGKHLLVWIEWMVRSGVHNDDYLREYAAEQLTAHRWEPPVEDAPGIFWDMLLRETREIERITAAQTLARESGDAALTDALEKILTDEYAHRDFLRDALKIIGERYEAPIRENAGILAAIYELPGGADDLFRLLA